MLKKCYFSLQNEVYEVWKYNFKDKQQGCFMILGRKKISLTLICLLSHFLGIQSKRYRSFGIVFALEVSSLRIWLLSGRRKCEAVVSNCQCNVNLVFRVMLIELKGESLFCLLVSRQREKGKSMYAVAQITTRIPKSKGFVVIYL